jgi:hypothetical protein
MENERGNYEVIGMLFIALLIYVLLNIESLERHLISNGSKDILGVFKEASGDVREGIVIEFTADVTHDQLGATTGPST